MTSNNSSQVSPTAEHEHEAFSSRDRADTLALKETSLYSFGCVLLFLSGVPERVLCAVR